MFTFDQISEMIRRGENKIIATEAIIAEYLVDSVFDFDNLDQILVKSRLQDLAEQKIYVQVLMEMLESGKTGAAS